MSARDTASERQVQAADPRASTWLSANAGSGKTRVLTDRVARLLLGGVAPERILCLTYTKAAASEMQNRLFGRLGEWAMLPEDKLREALLALGVEDAPGGDTLARARRLFARAIETPGGLKILTIHSFCAALLRRFPLEAGVSPGFAEMDDRSARRLHEEVLEDLALGAPDLMAGLAAHVGGEDIGALSGEIMRHRRHFPHEPDRNAALAATGLPAGFAASDIAGIAFDGSESSLIAALVTVLQAQTATMKTLAATLSAIDFCAPQQDDLEALYRAFLYDSGRTPEAKLKSVPTKKAAEALGEDLLAEFHAFMQRIADARAAELALAAAEKTHALYRFAARFIPEVELRKSAHGWLDFDDLIARARQLLTDPGVAQWVLYKLDGGIDHILVDEAQDTSPDQWAVIESLTQEFTAGEGSAQTERTIFVVGDKKQSIYSFQGADLRAFETMRAQFARRLEQAGKGMGQLTLEHSFRSSEAILRLVDLLFGSGHGAALGSEVTHIAFHRDLPGRVDLWPPVPPAEKAEDRDWWDPVDIIAEEHEQSRLARQIARQIAKMVADRTPIPDGEGGARAVTPGDFLILVRRRSPLFHQIIAACKAEGLAIAGADRMNLSGELAAKDLTALLSFLATPDDDLSLATVLRSPLFGWSEAGLYALAHDRGRAGLWEALRRGDVARETLGVLTDLRDQADFLRPYDLLERLLSRHDGRRRLLARLGPEAEDGIDAFLAQALAYERVEVPSLTGFLEWLASDEVQVKRQLDDAGDRIRVMTVHGAKGLESRIVILPDTARYRPPERDALARTEEGRIAWKTAAGEAPRALQQAAERARADRAEEDERLLYVALTRAETWLIVAAAGKTDDPLCWHARIEAALREAGAVEHETPAGTGLRLAHLAWLESTGSAVGARAAESVAGRIIPPWASAQAPAPPEAGKPLSPSDLGGAKALPGEGALPDEEAAKRRGRQLHRLLEHLPPRPEADWPRLARDLLAADEDAATESEIAALLDEARNVLSAPALAHLFAPGALTEVAITGDLAGKRVLGVIDRLLINPDRVLAVDFKSNRVVPERPEDVPEGLLRQMAAYDTALRQIYPNRRVETAFLWTRTARLMPLPPALVRASIAHLGTGA
ncbi:double-strand break repair helicase AddA [Alkalilacustris brevis]|uniref:double-strand break repair helicase AddA n=1 Tax=Alkalilacustris brevis TaxID=2026338 RepID=UPI000E0DD174|nr:double-strand break repair helicase AddA [Alkalilacustris brevis]